MDWGRTTSQLLLTVGDELDTKQYFSELKGRRSGKVLGPQNLKTVILKLESKLHSVNWSLESVHS